MKEILKSARDGVRDAIQRMDGPIDPKAEAMELTPAMISSPRKIAPIDDPTPPTGGALEQEVAARMGEAVETSPAPAEDRDAPLTEILQGMRTEPSESAPVQLKQPPARAPADYGRAYYLREVFGLVGVALLKAAEPDYSVSTGRGIADQLVMTYTIIRQIEGRVEQVLSILQRGAPGVGDVVSLADQSTLNLARQCLAAERQIRDRLQEIERKLER